MQNISNILVFILIFFSSLIPKKENKPYYKSIHINNYEYSLELKTKLINDTLGDYEENMYNFPIVLNQVLIFYKGEDTIGKYKPQIPLRNVSIKGRDCLIPIHPVFDISLLESDSGTLYRVYGANHCNGMGCPEYYAYFDMNGNCIFDNNVNENFNELEKYNINRTSLKDVSMLNFWMDIDKNSIKD